MTDKIPPFTSFLNSLNGSTPGELVVSYFNFLHDQFPGIQGGLYEYRSSPEYPIRLAGMLDAAGNSSDDQNVMRFEFPLSAADSGFIMFIYSAGSRTAGVISEFSSYFFRIFKLLVEQLAAGERVHTDMWANIIGRISHDLNALIHLGGETPEERSKIEQKKALLGTALPKLLLFSRPLQLSKNRYCFLRMIEAIIDKYEYNDGISYELTGNLKNVYVNCDLELIDLAVTELLDNAVFARKIQGGYIMVTTLLLRNTSPVQVSDWIGIEIRNSGGSIPEEFLLQVKNPFFTTWSNQGRAGMGLALADQIAKSHGGVCKIESNPHYGVKQIIFLPIVEPDEKA